MKIHSDKLTSDDLLDATRDAGMAYLVQLDEGGSRSRARRFEVHMGGESRYWTNSGTHGAGGRKAATWDEWGMFIAELFAKDPAAIIGQYNGRQDFIDKTTEDAERIAQYAKPDSYEARTHRAPWLEV